MHMHTACLSPNTSFPGFASPFHGLKQLSPQLDRLWCLVFLKKADHILFFKKKKMKYIEDYEK